MDPQADAGRPVEGSAQPQPSPEPGAASPSAEEQAQPAWKRAFNDWFRGKPQDQSQDAQPQPGSPASPGGPSEQRPATDKARAPRASAPSPASTPAPGPDARDGPINQEELDRLVQAETDRRAARAQQAEKQRTRAQRGTRMRELADPENGNALELAEVVREDLADRHTEEQAAQEHQRLTSTVKLVGEHFDAAVMLPLLDMLPAADRQAIIDASPDPDGLAHRRAVVTAAVARLREIATDTALDRLETDEALQQKVVRSPKVVQALLRNDTIRKSLLATLRGERPSPVLIEAARSNGAAPDDMNQRVRDFLRA